MLLSLSKGSPCPPSRSPPPRWGSGESARYVTRCGGDGGCTLETLKLAKSSKKVPRSRRKRRQRHKTSLFCCVVKWSNKRGLEAPLPTQQNYGFVSGLLYTRNRNTPFRNSVPRYYHTPPETSTQSLRFVRLFRKFLHQEPVGHRINHAHEKTASERL